MSRRPMMTERMQRVAPGLAALLAGGMVALLMPAAWMRLLTFVGTVALVTVLARRPRRDDERWYGD